MVSVCLVVTSGQNWEQQWSFVLSNFAPDKIYVIGELDRKVRPFQDYISIHNAEEIEEPVTLLMSEHGRNYQGNVSLVDYVHPDEVCYMFGSDNRVLEEKHFGDRQPDDIVYIPTSTIDTMYSFMAGAVTLYDRMVKRG